MPPSERPRRHRTPVDVARSLRERSDIREQPRFPDGSTAMLQGCPDCGGTKFEYIPAGRAERAIEPDSDVEEDTAQQAARGEMITADELPAVDAASWGR